MMKIRWMLLGCLLAGAASAEQAAWPVFQRDAARTGAAPKTPAVTRPIILWKTRIGIQGYLNNPVLGEGKVFVGSSGTDHNKADERDGIYCLDAKGGKVLWHRRTGLDACGVAYAAGRVFATGDDGYLRAFQAADGKALWQIKCRGELYSQPLPVQQAVLVGDASGTVFAADQATGEKIWSTKIADRGGPEGTASNVRGGLTASGDRVFAAFLGGTVACLDFKGGVRWKRDVLSTPFENLYPAPTLVGRTLYLGYADGEPPPPIKALNADTGKRVWDGSNDRKDIDAIGNIRSSFACWKGLLLYGKPYSNLLVAVSADSGKLQWAVPLGAKMFPHWPSPAIAGNVLYLPRQDGGLYAVDLPTRKRLWTLYLGDVTKLGPKLPPNIMPEGWEHCAWKPAVGQPLYASPALGRDGTIYVGSGQGWLYAIGQADVPAPMNARRPTR